MLQAAQAVAEGHAFVRLSAGGTLITEGDRDSTVYVLATGSLQISRLLDGVLTVLMTIDEPGAVVGEMVLLDGGRRNATVTALVDSDLIALTPEQYERLLIERSEAAQQAAVLATRRVEEGELAEVLANHFGLAGDETLQKVIGAVEWRRLSQGQTLFEEGDPANAVYFVVKGRLVASRLDPTNEGDVRLGEIGRGEVVGEAGVLRATPRSATVQALRDSVLAGLREDDFIELIEHRPRVMVEVALRALERAEDTVRPSPGRVLAVAVADGLRRHDILRELHAALQPVGYVETVEPARAAALLDLTDVVNLAAGSLEEVRVSGLLHEAEIETDYLILDVGDERGWWSRHTLGMADRVLIFVPFAADETKGSRLLELLDGCPNGLQRVVVAVHTSSAPAPVGSAALRDRFAADEILHVVEGSDADLARVARVAAGRANTLVLGGGGARGFAQIGVLRALVELGVPVDMVGGVSIGGILGAAMADGMAVDDLIEWAGRHFARSMDYTLPIVSLVKAARIARSAEETFGGRDIEDLRKTYFCVSTDLTVSRSYIHRRGSLSRAVRATSAIPGVMPPVPFGDHLLVDGGVLNNLPIDVARDLAPVGQVIAIDVAPPRGPGARKDYGLSVSGWEALRSNRGRGRRIYPAISVVLMRSMITASMQKRDAQVASALADCYLDLDMRGVSMLEFGDPAGVAQRGYEAAMPALEAWLADR